jgi:AsmA protein
VTLPVRVVGPFDAVDYKPQWSAVATELATQRAKGAVGDLLKGLGATVPAAGASAPAKPASAAKPPALKDTLKGLVGK